MYIIRKVFGGEVMPCNTYIPNKTGYIIFAIVGKREYVAIPDTYHSLEIAVDVLARLTGTAK